MRRPAGVATGLTLLVLLATTALVGCADGSSGDDDFGGTDEPAARRGDGVLHRETDPLTKRFPALPSDQPVVWTSGTFGSDERVEAPGPSTYWIDAVVDLSPGQLVELLAAAPDLGPAIGAEEPQVADELAEQLPPGPFASGPDLDAVYVSTAGWKAHVYLDPVASRLVLLATGDGDAAPSGS